jgi:anti-anti-sigma regulatory factor
MLRITTHAEPSRTVLILEGRLIGPWVMELRAAVAVAQRSAASLVLDLAGLHYADDDGVELMAVLKARGIAIRNPIPFVSELLREGTGSH